MYNNYYFNGNSLPPKTLSLSFDDGPGVPNIYGKGANTIRLAEYLRSEGISATFFVVGKNAARFPEILEILKNMGHLIGNHTFDHAKLTDFIKAGGDVEAQIIRTDAAIRHWVDGQTIFFRPPYGAWSNEITDILNRSMLASLNHVGPIKWDIDGRDWEFWQKGNSVDDALNNYLSLIQKKDHGILLNHDCSSDIDAVKEKNMTLELIMKLIPRLKTLGYKFVRLDEINDIRIAANTPLSFALKSSNAKFVSYPNECKDQIQVNSDTIGPLEKLTIVDIGYGKVALQLSNGLFFSPEQGGGGEVLATRSRVEAWELFDLIQLQSGRVAFRTVTGEYLTIENNNGIKLMANVRQLGESEIFTFCPLKPT